MKQPLFRSLASIISPLLLIILLLFVPRAQAGTVVWSGASGTDTNWSNGNNWAGTAPGGGDDVKFFDPGAVASVSNINNVVDAGFAGYIGSLQYGNTNNNHTTLITNGATLSVTNTGGLFVGTPGAGAPTTQQVNATVTGAGALVVSNLTANLVVNQGDTSGTGTQRSTLDLTGLNTFSGSVRNIFVGSTGAGTQPTANGVAVTGTLLLANTNTIQVVFSPANVHSTSCGIDVGYNGAGTQGAVDYLYLGQVTSFNVDTIAIGRDKGVGVMAFGPAFTNSNPTAVFRGTNGGSTRISYWTVGDQGPRGSGSGVALGTNDFTAGSIDAMVGTMILGQDPFNGGSSTYYGGAASGNWGVFSFNSGTLDVNTLTLGNIQSAWTNKCPSIGLMRINGNATLRVNTVLQMGYTVADTSPGTAAVNTYGQLGITNGTALINSITVASNTISANNQISITNAALIVSNAFATATYPLTNFYTANSLLGLTITSDSATKAFVGTLTTGGSTNVVQLGSTPVLFGSYPAQIPLIKYSNLAGSGYNFGLTNIPNWASGVSLFNNVANKSIDLVLPSDPRPLFIAPQPLPYSGSPGDNVTTNFAVTIAAGSVTPLGYQWYSVIAGVTNQLSDGPGHTGDAGTSTLSGSLTNNLVINNAQTNDSGSYFVVVTNAYGTNISSLAVLTISASAVAPVVTGPGAQATTNGIATLIIDSVSGSPVPTLHWQYNGSDLADGTGPSGSSTISGSLGSSTLTIINPQHFGDEGTYSLIASNSAGLATNATVLTVLVPPSFSVQPTNLVVTNTATASFVATASGVGAPTYQWYKNDLSHPVSSVANPTATNATFTIASASPSDIATYFVVVQNAAGSLTSSNATLTVNSVMSATVFSPTNGQSGVCYDTPLYVTFDATPVLRNAGTIKIYNINNSTTPVDTLDMSLNTNITQIGTGIASYPVQVQTRTIAGASYMTFPVIITSNTAAIYPHEGVMTSNQTYYVTIDNGVFTDTNNAYFVGITNSSTWQFSTRSVGPPAGTNYVVVSTDGTADFCTVQGAVDFLPNFTNTTAFNRVIYLRKGNSVEIVRIPVGKNNITLRGEDRQQSLLSYPNSNLINPSSHTVMVLHVLANDIAIENLKLTNSVPQGGSQSFALMVETGAKRFICNNADVDSYQDTILVNTIDCNTYFYKSLIQGDVDFIWGGGNCYFTNCELRELRTGGLYTQPRTPAGSNGMAFVRCQLTRFNGTNASGSNFTNCLFARALGNTNSNVGLIYCNIDTNCVTPPIGWTVSDITNSGLAERWWEYGNSNLDGTAPAVYNGIQLPDNDPRLLLALNATNWLYGWQPALAPNIVGQPANAAVSHAQPANFIVTATGIPDPAYQWYQNGLPIVNATNTNYGIASAVRTNGGNYTVVMSNGSGSVTSVVATLTYNNTAPVANPSTYSRPAGYPLIISIAGDLAANWSDVDGDTLVLTGISSTNGATVSYDNSYVYYTNANDVADEIDYTVGDGFGGNTPGIINVLVGPPPTNSVVGTVVNGDGSVTLSFAGVPGYVYQVDATTNLAPPVVWTTISTNTADINGLWQFTDQQATNYPNQFYRSVYRP